MLTMGNKYGNIHLNGDSISIEKSTVADLKGYMQKLEEKNMKLIEQQNEYLSQIMS